MASLNKVILIGNLTRDPELRYTPSGTAVAKFGLAINDKYKQGDEWKERVNFIDITVWGAQGENCSKYLAKGRQACIEGRLQQSTWETEEGQKRSKIEVVAERVVFLGGKGGDDAPRENRGSADSGSAGYPVDDDVPF